MFHWSVEALGQVAYHIEKRFINGVLAKIFEGLCMFCLMFLFIFFPRTLSIFLYFLFQYGIVNFFIK